MSRDPGVRTLQSNIKNNTSDMTGYSLFLGGLNVTNFNPRSSWEERLYTIYI